MLKSMEPPSLRLTFFQINLTLSNLWFPTESASMPPKKSPQKPRSWCLYPSLHESVSQLLKEVDLDFNFHGIDDPDTCIEEYDTNIMGRFRCYNQKCASNGWGSQKIAITIRMYDGHKYNARVYFQRCQMCDRLSKPVLDGSYAERVARRIKIWNNVEVDRPIYSDGPEKKPHRSALCEGCKAGHCTSSLL